MACPSNYDLTHAIEHNVIRNNAYARYDVKNARAIFGPSVPGLKGKMVKVKIKLPREDETIKTEQTETARFLQFIVSQNTLAKLGAR